MGFFFVKRKTAYDVRISDWSSDVCSSDLVGKPRPGVKRAGLASQNRQQRRNLARGECQRPAVPLGKEAAQELYLQGHGGPHRDPSPVKAGWADRLASASLIPHDPRVATGTTPGRDRGLQHV